MLQFSGLKDGLHEYSYKVSNEFFESFENTLVSGGNVDVKLELDKHPDHLNLHFTYTGDQTFKIQVYVIIAFHY
jgi:hypothetical protein